MDMVRPRSEAVAGGGKSPLAVKAEERGEWRGDPRQLNLAHSVKKSLVAEDDGRPYRKPTPVGKDKGPKVIE
jgi:hypothetical protein